MKVKLEAFGSVFYNNDEDDNDETGDEEYVNEV